MATTVKMTISLPQNLAEFVDAMAAEEKVPRSRVLAELLEAKRAEKLRKSLIEAYQSMAEESRRFAEEALPLAAEVWDEDP